LNMKTAKLLIILLVVLMLCAAPAGAAVLTFTSDLLSNSAPGVESNHTIKFTATRDVPFSGKIVIQPETGFFEIPDQLGLEDIDFLINGANKKIALSAGVGSGSSIGLSIEYGNSGKFIFTLNDSEKIQANDEITVKIGTQANFEGAGAHRLINPIGIGDYKIFIETISASSVILDKANAMIFIISKVSVGASKEKEKVKPPVVVPPVSSAGGGGGGGAIPLIPAPPVAIRVTSPNVILKFEATNAEIMAISENTDFKGSSWESYKPSKSFVLSSGLGLKKVYVKFRNWYGTETEVKTLYFFVVSQIFEKPTAATSTVSAGAVDVLNPFSNIKITRVANAIYQKGDFFRFYYEYKNQKGKTDSFKIIRQFLNKNGKVVRAAFAQTTLKKNGVFSFNVKDIIDNNIKSGEYSIKIKILDKKNKLLDENGFVVAIKNPEEKKFVLSSTSTLAYSDIYFSGSFFDKNKMSAKLPFVFKFQYGFGNQGEQTKKIRLARQLLDEYDNEYSIDKGKWTLASGAVNSLSVKQSLSSRLPTGNYTIRVSAFDAISGDLLAENILGLAIK